MKKKPSYINSLTGYGIALIMGLFVGWRTSVEFVGVLYVLLAGLCLYLAFRGKAESVLILLPYLIYTEMFIRKYVLAVPYLFLQYLFIALFGILILRK